MARLTIAHSKTINKVSIIIIIIIITIIILFFLFDFMKRNTTTEVEERKVWDKKVCK